MSDITMAIKLIMLYIGIATTTWTRTSTSTGTGPSTCILDPNSKAEAQKIKLHNLTYTPYKP